MGAPYKVIYADPGWEYTDKTTGGRGAEDKYKVMNAHDIAALPVADIAARDCVLFLWCTFPNLEAGREVIRGWGFKYKTIGFIWVKLNRVTPTPFWGMGNWTRSNAEPCLLAIRGQPRRVSAAVHSVVLTPRLEHSRKPSEVRDRIVTLMGDVPRVELFARQRAPGWDALGNELNGQDIRDELPRLAKQAQMREILAR